MAWVRDNWDKVLNVALALFGAGGIATFFTDFMAMCRDRPWQAIFLAALCLSTGYVLGLCNRPSAKAARERRREERKARGEREDYLRRAFSVMSDRRRAIVLIALESRTVSLPDLDTDAATLCQLGILGAPPFGFRLTNVDYSIQPAIADIVKSHKDEWMGGMTVAEAGKLVFGER